MGRSLLALTLALGASAVAASSSAAATPAELLRATCSSCHQPDAAGHLSRIAEQRKTPEGWAMTIDRMERLHGIVVSSKDLPLGSADAKRRLVKYLADTQGLAPSETAGFRYALEQRLDDFEPVPGDFKGMCGRCHSAARVLLQRRTTAEWQKLVHFHLGQFPSTEYSSGGRNLDWFPVALKETAPELATKYPFDSDAWRAWKKAKHPSLAGTWTVSGHERGKGDVVGTLRITATGPDAYDVALDGSYVRTGEKLVGTGRATVYTGYEWRATLTVGDVKWQQVFAAGELAGRGGPTLLTLQGRMYQREHPELGIDFAALRGNVRPAASRDALPLTLAGGQIDRITVDPPYQVARVGGGGGPVPKEYAVFEAYAWSNGPDRQPGTGDDVLLGAIPDVRWRVEPWNDQAREDRDVEFAGTLNPDTGLFTPGDAGPNPARKYGTNNAGNLRVIATAKNGDRELTADAHLIVTVQQWIHSPIP